VTIDDTGGLVSESFVLDRLRRSTPPQGTMRRRYAREGLQATVGAGRAQPATRQHDLRGRKHGGQHSEGSE
jgi:hypothetical protein